MSALPKRYFTPAEYLALEERAEYRSQYVAGEIFAMAGAQPWHNEIAGNIFAGLHGRFRGRPCKAYFADMRVHVPAGELWTYPDIAALCGEPKFEMNPNPHSLLNPQVIFEVLSPSTESFDRGAKFIRYRMMESLADYVLVASERMHVEHFSRNADGSWRLTEYSHHDMVVNLASVEVELSLAEIYDRVTFPLGNMPS
jgi:Uma2 family endonuclease